MAARKKAKSASRASAKKKRAPKKRAQQRRAKAAKAPLRKAKKTAARKIKKPARKVAKRAVAKRARLEPVILVRPSELVMVESVEEAAPGVTIVSETALSVPVADDDED